MCEAVPADSVSALADRFFAAIEAADLATVRDLYVPDAVIWHNYDGIEQTRDESVRTLAWAARHIDRLHYDEVRRSVTDTGFVQQHVVRGRNAVGVDVAMPACIVVTVAGGLIARLEEYLDSRHVEIFSERPPSGPT